MVTASTSPPPHRTVTVSTPTRPPPVRHNRPGSRGFHPHLNLGGDLVVDGNQGSFAFDDDGGVSLVETHLRPGSDEQVFETMHLMVAVRRDMGDTSGLPYLELRRGYHRALDGLGLLPTTFTLGDRHAVGTVSRMPEKRADTVDEIGVDDVLELTGTDLVFHSEYVVDETLGQTVRADELPGRIEAPFSQRNPVPLDPDNPLGCELVEYLPSKPRADIRPEPLQSGFAIFALVPKHFEVLFFFFVSFHEPFAD